MNSERQLRNKRISYSLFSALVSKVATTALQVMILPMAAVALGHKGFALYSMLFAVVGWLSLANLGLAPNLTVRMASVLGRNHSNEQINVVVTSAFVPSLVMAALVTFGALAVIWWYPVQRIFGVNYADSETTIRWGLSILTAVNFFQMILSMFEAVQAGYQRQYICNIVVAASSIPTIGAVLYVIHIDGGPVALIAAVCLPQLFFRVGHVAWMMQVIPTLRPSLNGFRKIESISLLKNGVVYSLAGSAGNFFSHVYPIVLVGRASSVVAASGFAATMNAFVLVSGVMAIVTSALLPAIADGYSKGDVAWLRRAYKRMLGVTVGFAFLVFLAFSVYGEQIFFLWFRGSVVPNSRLLFAAGIYFIASAWEVVNFYVLVALGRTKYASIFVFLRAGIAATVVTVMPSSLDGAEVFLVMAASVFCIDAVPLARKIKQEMLELSSPSKSHS